MKKIVTLAIPLSIVLLLIGIITLQSIINALPFFVFIGTFALVVFILILSLFYTKSENYSVWKSIVPAVALVAYIAIFLFYFETGTLGEYLPENLDNTYIQFSFSGENVTEYTWSPSAQVPATSTDEYGNVLITGGDDVDFYDNFSKIIIRNHWWSGAQTGGDLFDFDIYFNGERSTRLSISSINSTSANVRYNFKHGENLISVGDMLFFGNIYLTLPEDIRNTCSNN